ncbi:consortin, connexin sorting protein b [Halichoeres trimaculatus]|uniref:consortin, connexin sorting protein b n=1 Tax=Halichoeres trimaculatus TaxID=147232 RepID=UPI003D9FB017
MGNKNSTPPKDPGAGSTQKDRGVSIDRATGSVSGDGSPGLSTELLATLHSLRENSDYTLLPYSLHQIAEAYLLKDEYKWAIQFLQLEKMYHERLLSNLDALQENWESQLREKKNTGSSLPAEPCFISQTHMETLSQICRTHLRPSLSMEQNRLHTGQTGVQSRMESLHFCHENAKSLGTTPQGAETDPSTKGSNAELTDHQDRCKEEKEEEGGEDEEVYEGGGVDEEKEEEETCAETPEEEEVKVEWPTGVAQASDKDLAKLSSTEGSSAPDGLVSILKRRRASLDGLPPPSTTDTKQNSRRKVRFSEPEDGIEQDEVGGDSCLILLLLCLVTVVISIGGTALYCTLVDTYSNICTDFTQNVDFYVINVRRFFEGLRHWLPLRT